MSKRMELQGHRGARGSVPENTLPSFEIAYDCGVTSIETDLHLTRDGIPIIIHDPHVSERFCHLIPGKLAPEPAYQPAVSSLTLEQLRCYRADRNPDPQRFPKQRATITPLARLFAEQRGSDPFGIPTLADLFAFADAYVSELGARAGKSAAQRRKVKDAWFDLEIKRVPFHPERIGDAFDGQSAGLLELRVIESVRGANRIEQTRVRSFDHRSVRSLYDAEPKLECAVLVCGTAPVAPEQMVAETHGRIYCPAYKFLDRPTVIRLQEAGFRVIPWTVNHPDDWRRLIDWGIDGITTDFPEELARLLDSLSIAY